jgi:ribosomal protein S6
MPLYEMVLVCKLGESQAIANLIKSLTYCVYQEGGMIRRFINLGDRIPSKGHVAKDKTTFQVVRYFAVEFDANPDSRMVTEKVARGHEEVIKCFVHKLNDKDYYKRMINTEAWKDLEQDNTLSNNKFDSNANEKNKSSINDLLKDVDKSINRLKQI